MNRTLVGARHRLSNALCERLNVGDRAFIERPVKTLFVTTAPALQGQMAVTDPEAREIDL